MLVAFPSGKEVEEGEVGAHVHAQDRGTVADSRVKGMVSVLTAQWVR